jgi:hypothetical protein
MSMRSCILAAAFSGLALFGCQLRPPPAPKPSPAHRPDRPRPILTPRFDRHRKNCPQCSGEVANEEGGPPPLCEQGFELWKDDLRASKEDDK